MDGKFYDKIGPTNSIENKVEGITYCITLSGVVGWIVVLSFFVLNYCKVGCNKSGSLC
jgi:hypothetical protein